MGGPLGKPGRSAPWPKTGKKECQRPPGISDAQLASLPQGGLGEGALPSSEGVPESLSVGSASRSRPSMAPWLRPHLP